MLFSEAWGKMIHEKNLKKKISWHCPFKVSKGILPFSSIREDREDTEQPPKGEICMDIPHSLPSKPALQ